MEQLELFVGQLELMLRGRSPAEKESEGQYIIPRTTEDPTTNKCMLQRCIRTFCKSNSLKLPRGFYKKDYRQLLGMFKGMKKYYGFSRDDTIID